MLRTVLAAGAVVTAVPVQSSPAQAPAPTDLRVVGAVISVDGRPVPGALVTISGTLLAARTDDAGRFSLAAPARSHWLVARRVGFAGDSVLIDSAGARTPVQLRLRPAPQSLRAITVAREFDALSGATIAPQTMRNVPPLGEPDVFRTLVLLPGVAQPNDLKGSIHLAGGATDETGVRLDGHPMQQPFHVFGALGAFNVGSLDEATVRIHELPIDVDGYLGGVVDLRTRTASPDNNHELTVSMTSGSATIVTDRVLGAQLLMSGRTTYLDRLAEAIRFGGESGDAESLLGFRDALVRLRVGHREIGDVDLLAYGSDDTRDLSRGNGPRRPMRWGEWLGGLKWSASRERYSLGVRVSRDASYATYQPHATGFQSQFYDIAQRIAELDVQVARHGDAWETMIGATCHRRSHHHRWGYPGGPTNELLSTRTPARFDRATSLTTTATYAQVTHAWGAVVATAGLRATSANGRLFPAPRVAVRRSVTPHLVLSGAVERRHQFTSYLEEPKEGSILQPVYVLDRPRRADMASLGASWRRAAHAGENALSIPPDALDLTLFARRFPDRTLLRDDPRTFFFEGRALPPDFPRFARIPAHATGATLGLTRQLPLRSIAQLAYTYQRVSERFDGESAPSAWDAPHAATIYVNTLVGRHWSIGMVGQFRSGAATTPVAVRVFAPSGGPDDQVLATRYISASRNSARLPGYQRIDLAVRHTWQRRGGAEWRASLQVVNALGRDNVMAYDWAKYYCWRAGQCRSPGAAQRGLPIIPSLGFEARW